MTLHIVMYIYIYIRIHTYVYMCVVDICRRFFASPDALEGNVTCHTHGLEPLPHATHGLRGNGLFCQGLYIYLFLGGV